MKTQPRRGVNAHAAGAVLKAAVALSALEFAAGCACASAGKNSPQAGDTAQIRAVSQHRAGYCRCFQFVASVRSGDHQRSVSTAQRRFWLRGRVKPDYTFLAQKAFLRDALAAFFGRSPQLIIEREKLPDRLYDISTAGPPDTMPGLKAQFDEALRTNYGIAVLTTTQKIAAYSMTACATDAPGLKATSKRGGGGRPGGFYLHGTELKGIASFLEDALRKTVVDETGLTGLWDADIKWKMSDSELRNGPAKPANVINAAREQLGLELTTVNRKLGVLLLEKHS
jgi:uncharacterized protein (TIGR03435 family)